ncbi:MAG: nucleoside deaminase [Acidimicrobiia bacterium]|nr:nucleoside deaminase [Acidimicrobiia bacterium]MXX45685.1 nucleoside deaminase [Acidimicrobiia bacterium]MXY74860.1 nucleoside deaminase [Acidimicrobiia bacterium]MYA39087.1 nucleoside deaminase [Acidimicrobiia bacterium]MYB79806.1 nucleoside deaminase [Acidimicrobiia bacterium]
MRTGEGGRRSDVGSPLPVSVRWDLPLWAQDLLQPDQRFRTTSERMGLAVELSRRNVAEGTGGPFGAAVFDLSTFRPLALGVNLVMPTSSPAAHAEVVAICLAGQALGNYDLGMGGGNPTELVTSCSPCAMCLGAVPWSGVSSLVIAAREEDARSVGFDEGNRPPDWVDGLRRRGIEVTEDVLRAEAVEVLRHYVNEGGVVYNSSKTEEEQLA